MGLTQMIRRQPKWLIPPITFLVAQWCWRCPAGRRTPCSWVEVSTHGAHEWWMQYPNRKDWVSNIHDHGSCMSHVYMKWLQFSNTNDMTWMLMTTFTNATLTIYHVYHNCWTHDAVILCTQNMHPIWSCNHADLCTCNHWIDMAHIMRSIKFQFIQNKWHQAICIAVQSCHGVHFTSFPQNIIPHQLCIFKTIFNQWTLWVNWSSLNNTMIIKPFVNSGKAMLALDKICAMSKLLAKNLIFCLCV